MAKAALDIKSITPAQLSKLFGEAGEKIPAAIIRDDIKAGAPTDASGNINLIEYAAWLLKEWSA